MCVNERRGSLSGGCVEDDFLERVALDQFPRRNQVVRYGEGGLAPTLRLPCGGMLDVLVEFIEPGEAAQAHLSVVERALSGGELVCRDVVLGDTDRAHRPGAMDEPRVRVLDNRVSLRVGAAFRLLLAGLSPVAEYCANFALALGYEVILCDPRTEVTEGFSMPGVERVPVLPAVFISAGGCHGATAVVALTHDPRLDDLTLLEAVRTQAFYIGAMGSQRTSASRRERLARIGGLNEAAMARIHAPIGLNLGSKTPAEIGIAVMADIIRVSSGMERRQL